MITRNALARPILLGGLVLLIATEWLLPGPDTASLARAPAIPDAVTDSSTDTNIARLADTVLVRPLLSPTRRLPPAAGVAVDETLPRLSAIVVIGGSRQAIFAADGGKPELVSQGGQIGVYEIKSVTDDSVDLIGPNGLLTLKPQYASSASATPTVDAQ